MYQVIGIFLAVIIGFLLILAVYEVYKEGEGVDSRGWWLLSLFVLDVIFNIWSVLR